MYLSKEDICWTEREQKLRRNDLRRLFNRLQTQRERAPQSKFRQKPLMAAGKLPQAIKCKVKNLRQQPVDVTITDELQSGMFSQGVYKAHTKSDHKVVLKRVGLNKTHQKAYMNEKHILLQMGTHPNIIKLLGYDDMNSCWPSLSSSILVLQYAENGDLLNLNHNHTPKKRWNYAKQIVAAIAYAHSKGISHGDIKLDNILRHKDTIWVADWGHATDKERSNKVKGSLGYTSINMNLKAYSQNQLNNGKLYNIDRWNSEKNTKMHQFYSPKKEDIFTLACTLWFLLICQKFILHPENQNFWDIVDKIRGGTTKDVFKQTCRESVFTDDSERKERIERCLERCFLEDETKRLNIHQVNFILFDVPNPEHSKASRKRMNKEQRLDGAKRLPNHGLTIRIPTKNNI